MLWSLYIWSDGEISFDNSPRPLGDKGGTAKRLVRDSLVLQGENNPSPPVSPYPLPSERAVINCGPAVNPNVEARDPPERRGQARLTPGDPRLARRRRALECVGLTPPSRASRPALFQETMLGAHWRKDGSTGRPKGLREDRGGTAKGGNHKAASGRRGPRRPAPASVQTSRPSPAGRGLSRFGQRKRPVKRTHF